jgi:tellurite resistance protein
MAAGEGMFHTERMTIQFSSEEAALADHVVPKAAGETSPPRRGPEYLPVGLFGSVMGLTGLSVAWRLTHVRFATATWISDAIGAIAVLAFVAILVGYLAKIVLAPGAVKIEFHHPIAGNLFGTFFISLLLLPIVVSRVSVPAAEVIWVFGAVGMAVFAWIIVSRWMSDRQQVAHATPAWIIPVVGLLDIPLALPSLQLPSMHHVMIFSMAVGLFFAVPLFTLIFSRLVFETPMPDALQPTLLILLAPFAVGFSTYVVTMGDIDPFAQALYALTLFLLVVLAGQMRLMARCCPFRVSWWAVSFPLAACSIASLKIDIFAPGWLNDVIAICLLALASAVMAGLLLRTLWGLVRGELRTLSS